MRSIQYTSRLIILGAFTILGVLIQAAPVWAADTTGQSTQSIAQAFHIAKHNEIVSGALVSSQQNDSQTIELASTSTATRLVGIVDTYPLLAITTKEEGAHIVISGTTNALVSDINGTIHAGDKVTASPIAGVGMHATTDGQVIGTALADFSSTNTKTRTVKDAHGKSHTVRIGSLPLQIGIAYYQAPGSDFLPPFVQRVANLVAGRSVSLTRIITSSVLMLVSFIGIAVLVYVATRSAMISLGRNPLAAHDIRKSLYQTISVAGVVAAITLLAAYLILVV
jgi:hypothetical protein